MSDEKEAQEINANFDEALKKLNELRGGGG